MFCMSSQNTFGEKVRLNDKVESRVRVCENCGATDHLEMHHVRNLKDLKGKSDWEIKMISRNRKTLAVCSACHHKIHSGRKLD